MYVVVVNRKLKVMASVVMDTRVGVVVDMWGVGHIRQANCNSNEISHTLSACYTSQIVPNCPDWALSRILGT